MNGRWDTSCPPNKKANKGVASCHKIVRLWSNKSLECVLAKVGSSQRMDTCGLDYTTHTIRFSSKYKSLQYSTKQ